MRYVSLQKNKLTEFVNSLQKKYKVVAPVKKENLFVFAPIENPEEIVLIIYLQYSLPKNISCRNMKNWEVS